MRSKILAALAALVLIVIAAGFLVYRSLDDQTAAGADAVLAEFRAAAGPAKPARPGLPAQGVYEYTVTGKESIIKGITISRTLPGRASMMVFHRGDGFETDTQYSREHREQATFAIAPEGTFLTNAVTTIKAGPISTVRERAWKPRLLRFPTGTTKASTASGDYIAGDLKLAVTVTALPDETLDIGGTSVAAKVYRFAQNISGEYSGTRTETFWYDPASALVLRYTIESSIKGPTSLDFNADQTITSLTPRE